MPSTTEKIQHAALRNQELISILNQTDHAHSELEQQDLYISDLGAAIEQSRMRVADLDNKRIKEFKEHASYRDSVMKRFAYKVIGKKDEFAAKAEKEETEYFEALQDEHRAQELLKGQESNMEEAQAARHEMVNQVQQHDQAQRDLDLLHEQVFDGPSPGFPDEDAAEERRRTTSERYREMRSRADAQNHAIRLLESGMQKMNQALRSMDDALRHSRRDMWGGGTFTDMMERNALSKAEVSSMEARAAVQQAQRFDGAVGILPLVRVPQGDILSDVFFDNVFTDMMFHDKIKQGMDEMEHSRRILERMLDDARIRAVRVEGDVSRLQAGLEKARVDLQRIREREFERVVGMRGVEGGNWMGDGGCGIGGPSVTSVNASTINTCTTNVNSKEDGNIEGDDNRARSNNPFWQ